MLKSGFLSPITGDHGKQYLMSKKPISRSSDTSQEVLLIQATGSLCLLIFVIVDTMSPVLVVIFIFFFFLVILMN